MVRHIVIWNFREDMTELEKKAAAEEMKRILEPIKDLVQGCVKLRVVSKGLLPKSNCEIILDSLFESEDALNSYVVHPAHVEAGKYVRSVVGNRSCMDFYED